MVISNRDLLEKWPVRDDFKMTGKVSIIGQEVSDLVRVTLQSV